MSTFKKRSLFLLSLGTLGIALFASSCQVYRDDPAYRELTLGYMAKTGFPVTLKLLYHGPKYNQMPSLRIYHSASHQLIEQRFLHREDAEAILFQATSFLEKSPSSDRKEPYSLANYDQFFREHMTASLYGHFGGKSSAFALPLEGESAAQFLPLWESLSEYVSAEHDPAFLVPTTP